MMEQMTDNETKKGDLLKESNGAVLQQSSETEEEPRRSQRTRKLTERAQELHDNKAKKLQDRFTNTYNKWKVAAKQAKRAINGTPSVDDVQELMSKIRCGSADVKHSYENLRKCVLPGNEIRRRVDTCDAVSEMILERASIYLHNKGDDDDQTEDVDWPESGSVFLSSVSKATSKGSRSLISASSSSIKSQQSSLSSIRRQEAAAELAATQAALKVLEEIESEQQELENLEEEDRRKMALQEEENVARKKALEEKRRQIERLQTVKKLSAAKARLQVYEQEASSDEEVAELLHNQTVERRRSSGAKRSSYEHPPQADSATVLAEAIAESINVSRLPVPEPPVFNGDPLRYKDWKMSFQTLIGRKNIPVNESLLPS
uniref:PPUP6964 n=1 Tax=Poeciliopsis prolifica TaxID=188132 RepID=A0A0S7EZV3_9TELE